MVITEKTSEKYSDNKNERIEKRNERKIEAVKSELKDFYNGDNSEGTMSSSGLTYFKFNVTGQSFDGQGLSANEKSDAYSKISKDNAQDGGIRTLVDGNKLNFRFRRQ